MDLMLLNLVFEHALYLFAGTAVVFLGALQSTEVLLGKLSGNCKLSLRSSVLCYLNFNLVADFLGLL